jgi:hypothetical protein
MATLPSAAFYLPGSKLIVRPQVVLDIFRNRCNSFVGLSSNNSMNMTSMKKFHWKKEEKKKSATMTQGWQCYWIHPLGCLQHSPLHVPHSVNMRRVAPVKPPTGSAFAPVNITLAHTARIAPYPLS